MTQMQSWLSQTEQNYGSKKLLASISKGVPDIRNAFFICYSSIVYRKLPYLESVYKVRSVVIPDLPTGRQA